MPEERDRKCKYSECYYYDSKAETYCCDACSADAYDRDRLAREERLRRGRKD